MIDIIYEDDHIIVVVKPPGMPSQKDLSGDMDVYNQVKEHIEAKGGFQTLGLIQRLDRPVGGLMVLSKTEQASAKLTDMVTKREINKYYLALVEGNSKDDDHLEHWLQKVRGNRAVISNKKTSGGKLAVLDYRCLAREVGQGKTYSMLEVKLGTGRFHQIRAQLAHMKLPIVGDTKYNPSYQSMKGWHRIGLYAYKLSFIHPVTGELLTFEKMPDEPPFDTLIHL